jgi:hypothetical protein
VERAKAAALVLTDPAFGDFVDRNGIEVMLLVSPAFKCGDEIGAFENAEMLADGLPRHAKADAQIAEALTVIFKEPIEQFAAGGIGEGFEDGVSIHARITCNQMVACQERAQIVDGLRWFDGGLFDARSMC